MKQNPQQRIAVPDLQNLAQQARQQNQDTEIQLRVVALGQCAAVADKGEKLEVTMKRLSEFARFLYTGIAIPEATKK